MNFRNPVCSLSFSVKAAAAVNRNVLQKLHSIARSRLQSARSETRKAVRYLKSPQAGGAKEREPKCAFIQSPPVLSLRDPICLSSRRRGAAFPHLLVPPPTGNTSDFICSQNLGIIPFFNPMLLGAPATAPGFCPGLGVFSLLKGTIQRLFLCYCWSLLTKFFKQIIYVHARDTSFTKRFNKKVEKKCQWLSFSSMLRLISQLAGLQ